MFTVSDTVDQWQFKTSDEADAWVDYLHSNNVPCVLLYCP